MSEEEPNSATKPVPEAEPAVPGERLEVVELEASAPQVDPGSQGGKAAPEEQEAQAKQEQEHSGVPEAAEEQEGQMEAADLAGSAAEAQDPATTTPAAEDLAGAAPEAEIEGATSADQQVQAQLSKDEIAYGLSYFSHQRGYTNPYNVVTPDLFQRRMQPVCELSLHGCEHLLRAPFSGSINGRAVGGSSSGEAGGPSLGRQICLTPAQVNEIMNYRVGPSDDKDFALESFRMLGAATIKNSVPIEHVADLLISAYSDIETHLEEARDFQSVCEHVTEKNDQLERIRAKAEGREFKKAVPTVRTAPDPARSRSPPRLRSPNGLSRKAPVDPRCQYAIPLREDIIHVLRRCCGGDRLNYESWRDIFRTLLDMRFTDYREDINQAAH